jgi:hypothetical protein
MIESKYIYDLSEDQMISMNTMSYPKALLYLLEASQKLNARLNDVHYLERDFHRINKVVKAIKHNTQKLKEIGYDKNANKKLKEAMIDLERAREKILIHPNQSSIDDFLKA